MVWPIACRDLQNARTSTPRKLSSVPAPNYKRFAKRADSGNHLAIRLPQWAGGQGCENVQRAAGDEQTSDTSRELASGI
jgi:hypothetical protein